MSSTRPSVTEVLFADGVTGTLVDDARQLADAMATLLRDPARTARMGDAARDRVVRDFQPDDVARAIATRVLGPDCA